MGLYEGTSTGTGTTMLVQPAYCNGGYSGESSKDEIITELRGLMYDAPEHMKNRLRDFISEIER